MQSLQHPEWACGFGTNHLGYAWNLGQAFLLQALCTKWFIYLFIYLFTCFFACKMVEEEGVFDWGMHIPCKKGAFKYKQMKKKKHLAILYGIHNCHAILYGICNCHVSLTAWIAGANSPPQRVPAPWGVEKGKFVCEVGIGSTFQVVTNPHTTITPRWRLHST